MEIYQKVKSIPYLLRVALSASFVLGVLQIAALIYPELSPRIKGELITSAFLIVLMGCIHIALGVGIFYRKKWSLILIITIPFIQNIIYYLDTSFPSIGVLSIDFIFSAIWAIFFIVSFYHFDNKSYYYDA